MHLTAVFYRVDTLENPTWRANLKGHCIDESIGLDTVPAKGRSCVFSSRGKTAFKRSVVVSVRVYLLSRDSYFNEPTTGSVIY